MEKRLLVRVHLVRVHLMRMHLVREHLVRRQDRLDVRTLLGVDVARQLVPGFRRDEERLPRSVLLGPLQPEIISGLAGLMRRPLQRWRCRRRTLTTGRFS